MCSRMDLCLYFREITIFETNMCVEQCQTLVATDTCAQARVCPAYVARLTVVTCPYLSCIVHVTTIGSRTALLAAAPHCI